MLAVLTPNGVRKEPPENSVFLPWMTKPQRTWVTGLFKAGLRRKKLYIAREIVLYVTLHKLLLVDPNVKTTTKSCQSEGKQKKQYTENKTQNSTIL